MKRKNKRVIFAKIKFLKMENNITYYTNTPHVHRKFADVLAQFKELQREGEPPKVLREYFLKDELLALLLWFYDKSEEKEDITKLFTEFVEVG
jgi:hypothetical protein